MTERDGLEACAPFFAGKLIERTDAIEAVAAEGGLSPFEQQMFKIAKLNAKMDGVILISILILEAIAREVGFKD